MKKSILVSLILLFAWSCEQIEPDLTGIGEVKFQSVLVDSFSGNLPNGRIAGPSTWKHVFKSNAVLVITNKSTGEVHNMDYNPNEFGEGFKVMLPYGSYTYFSEVGGGAFEKYLPFRIEGEFNLGVSQLDISLSATTKYGLITVKNEYVESLGIRNGTELCDFKLLADKSYYFLYAKKDQTAKLEIIESLSDNLIKRDVPISAYNHYNFYLKKAELNGTVNFIELSLGVFEYIEEGIEIGEAPDNQGLLLWNKLGSLAEVTNSEYGPNLIPAPALLFREGKFGNGLYVPQIDAIRSVHTPYSPRNVIPLDAFNIEFWYKRTHDDESEAQAFIDRAVNDTKGTVQIGQSTGYVGRWWLNVGIRDNNGNWVGQYHYDLGSRENWEIFYPKNEWIHIGVSHDAGWPAGQRIKIFRNGVELSGLVVDLDMGNMGHLGQYGLNGFSIGSLTSWERWGMGGIMDNIKVWNYAKTDFSDRINEGN